ncbi:O-antigen ligase family protein [Mucilaginibacter jinjuensis]|uniref:O-antigen ligase family protein n=1 Tax=Mucilaginibacter jinjuensis TaxID=1176721 RepID=A0ABY7T387_9SPHI|nr:O-antigen ligase family protein [Mucilaginibacter jinjuensis]WCT10723.1 O-antigen ligase family protein [Mucilaginibacter jinjuensis]
MLDKLIVIIPGITLLLFVLNIFYRGNNVQSCLIFILSLLPLMDMKITPEAFGGFKTFDAICFYSFIFLFKDFITINLKSRNNIYFFLFILLGIIILLGGLSSEFPGKTWLSLIKALPIFIFARFFMTECYKDTSFFLKAIKALKVGYVAAIIFLLIQRIVGLKFTFYPGLSPNTFDPIFNLTRYPGIFYDAQAHGQFLAMGSFLFLYIEKGASRRNVILNYTFFVLCIVGINMAGSRAAFGGLALGLMVVFFMAAKNYRIYGLVFMVLGYLAFSLISIHTGVFDRAKNLSDDLTFRQNIWKEAFDISKQHPYLGIGDNNYQSFVIRHNQDQYLEIEDGQLVYFDQPENGYLKIMVELGFIGFGLFVLLLLIPLIKGLLLFIENVYDKRVTFFMASLISFLVAFNTVYSIFDNRLLIMVASMVVLIVAYPINTDTHELVEN